MKRSRKTTKSSNDMTRISPNLAVLKLSRLATVLANQDGKQKLGLPSVGEKGALLT
jgi:hypothetical protein